MSKVFFDIGLSLDGFIAGENRSPQNPMGGVAPAIHQWMFNQKAFWEHLKTTGGEEDTEDGDRIRQVFARTGAYIMGKRMFEEGEVSWPEDLFMAPVYVLTHEKREPWVQKGSTTFYFINDGMESAFEKARASAGKKDIRVQGGANLIWQYFNGGYIDEFTIHVAPVLLGSGIRFFDGIDRTTFSLKTIGASHTPLVSHLTYSVGR
ncbi:dihydrofolate reductase family protein [Puia dinghuensis]|uniref:Deaminase n=1 Tax=Puia dinghuensis TaxID=1792502 RepID=A0A8J2UH35_9BACT|nr:dihydrofolate reductase family protein [Puia dinghuensis]GGB14816.1 deaminase [Puia dinghuensis]